MTTVNQIIENIDITLTSNTLPPLTVNTPISLNTPSIPQRVTPSEISPINHPKAGDREKNRARKK